jgi:preprotein translocase SecF subunit
VTLTIGVALSLFTSLVMTRLIFDYLLGRGWLNRIGMLHLIKNPHWDFMKWAKPAFIASWTIILVGMCYGVFVRGKSTLGIDFVGGDAVTLSYKEKIAVDQLRTALAKVGEVQIQYQKGAEPGRAASRAPFGKGTEAGQTLAAAFPSAGFKVAGRTRSERRSGRKSRNRPYRLVSVLFFILFYVALRYEFSFSVGAVLAVIHDVLMTIGIFCLSGRQFSAPIVAAILTIIGFSINDTIVIFDRIREDLKLGIRGSFKDVMNIALNQTLSRTLITSGTVFIATPRSLLFRRRRDQRLCLSRSWWASSPALIPVFTSPARWCSGGTRASGPRAPRKWSWKRRQRQSARLSAVHGGSNPNPAVALGGIHPIHPACRGIGFGPVPSQAPRNENPRGAALDRRLDVAGAPIRLRAGAMAGEEESLQFLTGYLVEYSLSLDNLLAMTVIFASFGVAAEQQHRVLCWGIVGALIMRGVMIGAGAVLLQSFHWLLYLMGLFLVVTGLRWAFSKPAEARPHDNPAIRLARKFSMSPPASTAAGS